jgi:hypothetical protein
MPETGEERCVICQEAITNPICPECLQREIEHWLADTMPSLIGRVKGYAGVFDTYRHEATHCVICGNTMSICAHCFCKDIYELIESELGEVSGNFLFSFNFDLFTGAG